MTSEDITERLATLARRRERLERDLDRVRAETAEAIAEGDAAGLTAYRMARVLGLSQAYVGRIRNGRA